MRRTVALLLAPLATLAQQAPAPADNPFDYSLEQLLTAPLTTGTRFEGRPQSESPVPLSIVTAADLRTGAGADLAWRLHELLPSLDVLSNPIGDGSSFIRAFNLRGLPPDSTLVLVNGRRRHRAALVHLRPGPLSLGAQGPDIAQLPAIALQRVELLRDGAAAQYGSDAVAGVLNLILREDAGTDLRAQYAETTEGDGDQRRVSAYHGRTLGAPDRRVSVSAEWVDRDEIARGEQRPDAAYYRTQGLAVDDPAMVWGTPQYDALRSMWNMTWDAADQLRVYGFGNFARSQHDGGFFYRNLEQDFFVNSIDTASGALVACPGVPSDQYGYQRARACLAAVAADPALFNFLGAYPAGFTPRFSADIDDLAQVIGVAGRIGTNGRFDLAASAGRNTLAYGVRDTINPSLGPASPTDFDPGELEQTEYGLNLDLSWSLAQAKLAGGLEWREEGYRIGTGDTASWQIGPYPQLGIGANGFPGFDPQQAGRFSRHNASVYLDGETHLGERLLLAAALRYEDYSDFGDTLKGKLAARYELRDGLSLRGTLSSGFRAPTPGQSNTINVRTQFDPASIRPVAIGLVPAQSPIAAYFGGEALEPEDAINRGLGLSWQSGAVVASIDLFRTDITDRIALGPVFTISPELRAQLVAAGVPRAGDFGGVQFFSNSFDTRTQGIEAELEIAQQHAAATTRWRLAYSRIETRVVDIDQAGALTAEQRYNLEHLLPRDRVVLAARHMRGDWSLDLSARIDGPWQYQEAGWTEHFDAGTRVDIELGRRFLHDWSLALGADNVFDSYPGRSKLLLSAGNPYVRYNPQSIEGMHCYLRLERRF